MPRTTHGTDILGMDKKGYACYIFECFKIIKVMSKNHQNTVS